MIKLYRNDTETARADRCARWALVWECVALQHQMAVLRRSGTRRCDRTPKPMSLSGDADDELIEMPDVTAAGPLAAEPANEILAEFESRTPHGLVGDHDLALKEHFLDKAQAQRESEIKPNDIGDDLDHVVAGEVATPGLPRDSPTDPRDGSREFSSGCASPL
jgi:hypothetical protein